MPFNFDIEVKIKEEQLEVYEGRLYNVARQNINAFCELVMRDQQTGQSFKQAPIHLEMQQHIDWCLQNGFYAGILSHFASGKCQGAFTKITMADGSRRNLIDVKKGDFVLTLDQNFDYRMEKVKEIFKNGERVLYKIKTKSGREVDGTGNHPFLTISGWKELRDLKVGMFIGGVREYYLKGNRNPDKYIPEFLGLMLGNGQCGDPQGHQPQFTDTDPTIVALLSDICTNFGWELKKSFRITYRLNKNNSKISAKDVLNFYGMRKHSKDKTIPEDIFGWSNQAVAKFIGAYFSCDGWFTTSNRAATIGFGSASKKLLISLQSLLLRFGILSYLRYKKAKCNGKEFDSWFISFGSRETIKKFYESIPIYKQRKKDRIKEWLIKTEGNSASLNIDFIPQGWEYFLNRSAQSHVYATKRTKQRLFFVKCNKGTSREKVLRFAELDKNDYLKNICKNHIFWDEIIEIKEIGEEETFNLEIENSHNYIANDFFVHNSSQVIARILYMIGKDPNKRIKIVCNTDEFAMKRVSAIRDYLEKSEEYKKIFPGVVPEIGREKWTEHRLNVTRKTYGSADYSIEAGGIFSAAISGRCDVLIGDDICDFKNSKISASNRLKVIETWKNDWLTRLEPNGFVLYIATPWHKRDCTHDQMKSVKFAWKIFEVTKDLEKLKVTKKYWKVIS